MNNNQTKDHLLIILKQHPTWTTIMLTHSQWQLFSNNYPNLGHFLLPPASNHHLTCLALVRVALLHIFLFHLEPISHQLIPCLPSLLFYLHIHQPPTSPSHLILLPVCPHLFLHCHSLKMQDLCQFPLSLSPLTLYLCALNWALLGLLHL